MIIRKPYAFLIKNFKRIHIVLLLLSLFVAYKVFDVSSFVNEFMKFGTYDYFKDPITNHISTWLQIAIIIIVIGSTAILFLLRYKEKPWKLYLIPIIEYTALYFVLNMIKGFFNIYTSVVKTTDVRLSRDLLIMAAIVQIPAIVIFIMRVFGLDKKRFNFNQDEEFLNLNEKDREEVEINIDIDKNSIKRFWKRTKRNINYFYTEHKGICIGIAVILVCAIAINSYKFIFVTNKTYSAGELYSANGYSMKIKNAYFTDKDYHGKVITKKSDFVIVEVEVKNNSKRRSIEMENFHIKNGTKDYVSTRKTYANEFYDLGTTYDVVKELNQGEETSFIIVYKVDKDLDKDKFVMYYQEKSGYLRKIKIKVQDLSKIEKQKDLSLGDYMKIETVVNPDEISIDEVEVTNSTTYITRECRVSRDCNGDQKTLTADENHNILVITFGSEVYTAPNMIKFLTRHGKITYVNSAGEDREIEIENAITKKYSGKLVFLKVPKEVTKDTELTLNLVIRNKEYNYKLV